MKVFIFSKFAIALITFLIMNLYQNEPMQGEIVGKEYVPASTIEIDSYSIQMDAPTKEIKRTCEKYVLLIEIDGVIEEKCVSKEEFMLIEKGDLYKKL